MVNRIYIVTLIILFFLSVGRASVRADILMVVNSVMLDSVIKPDECREVYRWVLADKNVPDRKEVLMLIRYHYGNFGKLTELLFYLNEGKACKYLLQFVFPRIGSYTVHSKEFPIAGIRMPEKALPVIHGLVLLRIGSYDAHREGKIHDCSFHSYFGFEW